jgi:glutamate/tyrosine decarboxylase-like PLP-dependent enzyme
MLQLPEDDRQRLWQAVTAAIEEYQKTVRARPVAPELDPAGMRARLARFDFTRPVDALEAVRFTAESLGRFQVHTPHPRYYGLFNPAPTTMGIAADALVAAFNPQMAAWSHNPFAAEVERHVVRALAARFGYAPKQADGTFTAAGAEANHTAVLTALTRAFPDFGRHGVRGLERQPVLYISAEGHHSIIKAARLCGLGSDAVREIPVDHELRLDVERLGEAIRTDRREGFAPFLLVATAGTTSAGVIDPLREAGDVSAAEGLWLHADAAWGGAAALVPELKPLLDGIERADSITFDAHKWLSVPMGAGMYLTRHADILEQTFRVANAYMPREANDLGVADPYAHSMQWSRRFTGLKVFLSLAVAGWEGYTAAIRHQTAMGERLRQGLESRGWEIVNRTALPVVCFADTPHAEGRSAAHLDAIARDIVSSGKAWISTTRLAGNRPVLRACITNYLTEPADVDALVVDLDAARGRAAAVTSRARS